MSGASVAAQTSPDTIDVSDVDSTPLDLNDDLFDVQRELNPLAARWKSIGIALRLKPNELDIIQAGNNSDPIACLTLTVTKWLNRNYNVGMFGEPTWRWLVEAVSDPAGGANMALAREIARRHKAGVQQRPVSSNLQGVEKPQISICTDQESSSAAFFKHENQAAIRAKFADFQTKVCEKLVNNGVNIELIRLFVENQFPPGNCIPPPPAGVIEIFRAITHHGLWSYWHYSPLEKIVRRFGDNDSEMESWVETYKKDLRSFCLVTKIEDIIDATLPPQKKVTEVDEPDLDVAYFLPKERAKNDLHYYCPMKWKTQFMDHSLQYLSEVWEAFSCCYLEPKSPPTALLNCIREGCFSVTWLVPSYLIPALTKRAKTDTEFFQQHHIIRVTVGEECVYEKVVGESASLDSITSEQKCPQYNSSDLREMAEAPSLRYTGPLTTKQYHKFEEQFTNLYLSTDYEQIQKLCKQILDSENISTDIKVFALCWQAISEANQKNFEDAERLLRSAWGKVSPIECENGLLLQGRVLRHLAHFQHMQGHDDKALEYMSGAKQRLFNAAPSNETALALYTELRMKRRILFSKTFSSEMYISLEKKYELLLEHAKYMEEYEKPVVCNFFTMKASFHLRSDMITDELPSKECWPSSDDLLKAEECLKRDTMPSQINAHTARYYRTLCDLHMWRKQYPEAMYYLKEARKVYGQMKVKDNNSLQRADQRLKLLERLKDI